MKNYCIGFMLVANGFTLTQPKALLAIENVFTHIYEINLWGSSESVSGSGSTLEGTKLIRQELPRIINQFSIQSILDVPCGDFNWMNHVPLEIPYIGVDIVKPLISKVQHTYQSEKRKFLHLDLTKDELPNADLVLCRDCLVHLSISNIFLALKNIKRSGAKYLLTTTYPTINFNAEIINGAWRPLNLMLPPFNFPAPLLVYNEGHAVDKAKAIALWEIKNLPSH